MAAENKLIDLNKSLQVRRPLRPVVRCMTPIVEKCLGLKDINGIYDAVRNQLTHKDNDPEFFNKTLRVMGVTFDVEKEDFERIPSEGPLIVVANHPFGGIDGIVLGALLNSVRKDAKLMGNYLLANMDGIRGSIVEVDPFESKNSARANLKGMRQAIKLLREGGCLGVFPAGEVSSFSVSEQKVRDPEWNTHVASLARKTKAKILPIFFKGRNSNVFQAAGVMHPRLRTALLARELSRSRNRKISLTIGQCIESKELEAFSDAASTTDFLRLKTYALQDKTRSDSSRFRFPFLDSRVRSVQPLISPIAPSLLQTDVAALPAECCLVKDRRNHVYIADAEQLPNVMLEIGRLREKTFRSVQEGTGKSCDLDRFDSTYKHLFMWNPENNELVGAYRIGLVDEIVKNHGLNGLYSSTLFRFDNTFIDQLGGAVELGRSFIRPEYQRKHASLALIWRGIGEFVVRNPEYCCLFGPVSITRAYNSISKDLMVSFFQEHNRNEKFAPLVQARNFPKAMSPISQKTVRCVSKALQSVDSVSAVISGFEKDKKGIPTLLRHYLKLNGSLLSFNLDPDFSDVIDGLILVDLRLSDPRLLKRYFGDEGYGRFARYNNIS